MHIIRAIKAPLPGLACAATLTLGLASFSMPVSATQAPVVAENAERAPAASGKWINLQHDSHSPTTKWTTRSFKSKARVLQIAARCWGAGAQIEVYLRYDRPGPLGYKVVKDGKWDCTGANGYVRVHNAKIGGRFRVTFGLNRKQTIEYWAQNWMP
jgi:hypothetical protein